MAQCTVYTVLILTFILTLTLIFIFIFRLLDRLSSHVYLWVCVHVNFSNSPKLTSKICWCCGLFCVAKICTVSPLSIVPFTSSSPTSCSSLINHLLSVPPRLCHFPLAHCCYAWLFVGRVRNSEFVVLFGLVVFHFVLLCYAVLCWVLAWLVILAKSC